MYMGKPVSRRMLSAVRKLCGQVSTAPTGVLDQSIVLIRAPISPPPASGLAVAWARRSRSIPAIRGGRASSRRRDISTAQLVGSLRVPPDGYLPTGAAVQHNAAYLVVRRTRRASRHIADNFPVELVGSRAPYADPTVVNSLQVVHGAQRGEIRQVVAPAPRSVLDVVRMIRGLAAPRDRAEALVPLEDLSLQGAPGS